MKIVFCGGHHNSALLVAEFLMEKGYEIYWFGHKFSMFGDKNPSAEYLEVTAKNIKFIEINAGKWQPKYKFWQYLLRIPLGFVQSFYWLLKIGPEMVFSSGGYLAYPVALTGWLLGIKVVTHEQTVGSGLANKIIAHFSKKVFISFESSRKFFPQGKVIFSGLPIRPLLFKKGKKLFNNKNKTIYVTGGKQGAHIINKAVFEKLSEILKKFNLIHQCGSNSLYNDFDSAMQFKDSLGERGKNYLVKEYFFDTEIGNVFYSSDFVVSRCGAHTIYELMMLKKPSLLIPIPWSNRNEQEKNAEMLVDLGLAEILPQEKLEKGKLLEEITEFSNNLNKYRLISDAFVKENATEIISTEMIKILNKN